MIASIDTIQYKSIISSCVVQVECCGFCFRICTRMTENVYLFVPNLIDYARIFLASVSFYYMADSPGLFAIFYLFSTFLDELDGYFSRKLNQTSKFGALLDMLIDRCVTTCLMVTLSNVYSSYRILFQFLISLDVSSHWFHMYSSMIKGDKSHKITTNFFLKLYYESWSVLTIMCWGNEVFFVMLYLIHFSYGPTVFTVNNAPVGLWSLLVYVSFPICFLKQLINVVQLMIASQDVVAYDMAERRKSKS